MRAGPLQRRDARRQPSMRTPAVRGSKAEVDVSVADLGDGAACS